MNIIPIITIEKSAKKGPDIIENGNNKKIYSSVSLKIYSF